MWVFIGSIFLYSCKPGVPKNIIQPDKMEKVLYDIHIADGYIATIPVPDSAKKVAASYYNGIYKKFDIDSAQYNNSMDFYFAHPDAFEKIYKKLNTAISNQLKGILRVDSLSNAARIKASMLIQQRKEDSTQVNYGFNFETAQRGLTLPAYKNIYSKEAVIFDVRKLKKDGLKTPEISAQKIKTDSVSVLKQTVEDVKTQQQLQTIPALRK